MSTQEFNTRLLDLEKSLRYFALSLTKDMETAKDLVQDTFVKAIQYRDKYTADNNIKAWLFTILRNTYLNQVTKLSAKNTINDETEDEYILKNTMYEEYNAENSINTKDIQSTIDNLEDDYRIPFQLFVDGYKYKEIADKTNLPIGTVKSRIFFARRQLMENLESFK
ncbi:MAG: RNA polymerase sigma factor [Bacteroidota bacterium]|jgi:RNA polymerase sigma factor (sigma-70 family)|nr:RNA polymerase sigma factor [Bacteroidales bacterium]MDI9535846.1 RNA polymerase sigma factor [Bacteroidota bacterium]OQC46820.1 MAG: ECF RNA polymerase sigma factor SigR [Bacteroidetes bacterium ADurb.Bin028]NLP19965.1 RNA polymerase sigma factor [Bacteroidales bacterium]HNY43325.1 RNA polymerase sigma factor [Bacteroidales bacterium]